MYISARVTGTFCVKRWHLLVLRREYEDVRFRDVRLSNGSAHMRVNLGFLKEESEMLEVGLFF